MNKAKSVLLGLVTLAFCSCDLLARDAAGAKTGWVIELISPAGDSIPPRELQKFGNEQQLPAGTVYRWKNRVVIYTGTAADNQLLLQSVNRSFSNIEVKLYENPFYIFTRGSCDNTATSVEWKNILLTANLVPDTAMQREYLNYHKTQFTEWPEVSAGFCMADFQQLLVYKNERQLMLIISIPKNKTLDELNPRTTRNNPRANDWNNLMKKYQEGIPGTAPGETWIFLKPVN